MTNSELKKKIVQAKDVNWHTSVEETFNFSYVDYVQTFTGVSAIYEFVNQQIKGWEKFEQTLPSEFLSCKTYFKNIRAQIISFVENYSPIEDGNLQHYWSTVRNQINAIHTYPLPYNSPQTEFLIKIYNESPNYFPGAYNFIIGINYAIHTRELFFGAVLAYEFNLKEKTTLIERKKLEQKSISRLKNDFQEYLSTSEAQLVAHLDEANQKSSAYAIQIDELKDEKENEFSDWFEDLKTEKWQKWYDEKIAKLEKLEETYETKLKLEKPAKYWQMKSSKYYKQGQDAKTILIWTIAIISLFLGLILILSPDWIFITVFNSNSAAIIRWSIVFITLITLVAFSVKALTKYMFSSYHLARDAEERHTLTFFYLALLKDTEVKDDDRKLILQSLFSRVETGLLKDDSSPTMPSDIISKVISKP